MTTFRPSPDDISMSVGTVSSALFVGPLTIQLPADPTRALDVVEALQKALRGLFGHCYAQAYAASKAAEEAAARAVNSNRDTTPFGWLPSQRENTDTPQTSGDAA